MADRDAWWNEITHDEYPFVLAGAHRRRLTPLGAPALVRHLAFWNANPPPPRNDERQRKSTPDTDPRGNDPDQVWRRAIACDECIAAIYTNLLRRQGSAEDTAISGLNVPDAVDTHAVLFASVIDKTTGLPALEHAISHILTDSYRAIKFLFRWHGIDATLSFELHSEYWVATIMLDLSGDPPVEITASETFSYVSAALNEICSSDLEAAKEKAIEWRERLYDHVWNEFSHDVLECLTERIDRIGKMFVDFRGLIMRPCPEPKSIFHKFIAPHDMQKASGGPLEERKPLCDPAHLQRIWPLIHGFADYPPVEERAGSRGGESTEYTVSLFLEGRAVYATALGSQASLLTREPPKPLYYFLYEDTLFPWQLGRLIYRIHRAGTARLAALMHFGKLRDAYQILGEIETRLEQDIMRPARREQLEEFRGQLRDHNDEIEELLARIARLDLEYSLESRVGRSRYYVKQFESTVKSLRIGRVDGYQTYGEFVQQRLGPMFDYIDRLGHRFTRIQQDRLLLIGRIQALDSQAETAMIANAQRIADYGLSGVLGPYYMAYTLSHSLSGVAPVRGIWIGALLFCPMIMVAIFAREARETREARVRLSSQRPEDRSASASPKLWPGILGKRRLTVFLRLGVLAGTLGLLADFVATSFFGLPAGDHASWSSESVAIGLILSGVVLLPVAYSIWPARRHRSRSELRQPSDENPALTELEGRSLN